jgi:acyl-CoA thioester hydrolase
MFSNQGNCGMSEAALTSREEFSFWYEEKLRFSDIDMLGHVNNVAYAALIETGRIAFMRDGLRAPLPPGALMVMVRIEIDYRAELHYPATVQIGSRLMRVGRTSVVIGSSVFRDELCAATSVTTLVLIDRGSRRPVPIPEDARAGLERHLSV